MDYVRFPSSFDDDDNKYRKTWVRSTRTTIIAGIVIICIFVAVMRFSSASYVLANRYYCIGRSRNQVIFYHLNIRWDRKQPRK